MGLGLSQTGLHKKTLALKNKNIGKQTNHIAYSSGQIKKNKPGDSNPMFPLHWKPSWEGPTGLAVGSFLVPLYLNFLHQSRGTCDLLDPLCCPRENENISFLLGKKHGESLASHFERGHSQGEADGTGLPDYPSSFLPLIFLCLRSGTSCPAQWTTDTDTR